VQPARQSQALIKFLAQSLVEDPQAVEVIVKDLRRSVVLKLEVAPEDTGRVIGKQGRVAGAMRVFAASGGAQRTQTCDPGNRLTQAKDQRPTGQTGSIDRGRAFHWVADAERRPARVGSLAPAPFFATAPMTHSTVQPSDPTRQSRTRLGGETIRSPKR
jgi:predicted RNA-binding protein YlqC (UPF0109 family)